MHLKERIPLARQAKILSFDEAKRTSRTEPRSVSASRGAQGRDEFATGGAAGRATGRAAVGAAARVDAVSANASANIPGDSKNVRSFGPAHAAPERTSKWAAFKRERAKSKANRTFSRQYGDTPSSTSSGPRAAVYKGEMGASHKRAARMQNEGSNAGAAKKRFSLRAFSPASSPQLTIAFACAICVVLTCVFLYPSAKQCYVTMRECDRLQAEYEAIENRNAAIQEEIDALATDEGLEDRAREELGWSKTGEHAVTVYGLGDEEDETAFSANIVAGSVKAPETWYSRWLDPLFGVE